MGDGVQLDRCYIVIDGVRTDAARQFVRKLLLDNNKDIHDVRVKGSVARIDYEGTVNDPDGALEKARVTDWISQINGFGIMRSNYANVSRLSPFLLSALQVAGIVAIIVALIALSRAIFGYDILTATPMIGTGLSIGMVFVTGLLTSFHCVGMCGAINLATVFKNSDGMFGRSALYNIGRLISYTAIGCVAGAVGSVLALSRTVAGVLISLAALLMILMALNLAGIIRLPLFALGLRPPRWAKGKGPFVVGLLNGFMPCGPLQSMQLYALATGSVLMGGLSMLVFGLGTVPLMFTIGVVLSKLGAKWRIVFTKVGAALILVLAAMMLGRGLQALSTGISMSKTATQTATQTQIQPPASTPATTSTSASASTPTSTPTSAPAPSYDGYAVATIEGDHQVITTDLAKGSFGDIVVYAGIPVEFHLNVDEANLTECNNALHMDAFGVGMTYLQVGDNVIEFTPNEVGDFEYSCWMDMIYNKVKVVEYEG